ncbi:hypothetical protein NXS98_17185 [Fontisphaera persica]|uniref:hypothetical protein n=1 Tax=Fontisphaera persica TaxID=2974023 RepID=UPI0024C09FC8|nr:hypothetical protein [Fontisphaera persica]WCJ59428.1 hypothetical protein NXS98_17185 [Fontisphaera persica]
MGIQIQRATPDDMPAVQAFNARLRAGGITDFKLPETAVSTWLPRDGASPLYEELWLAKDGPDVRGGYVLKHQPFRVGQETLAVGYLYSPVSEALVDSRFGALGLQILLHAQRQQPLLYCLGMGGLDRPLPRLLQASRWQLVPVPFLFYPARPAVLLRELPLLQRTRGRALAARVLAATGLAWLGLRAWQAVRQAGPPQGVEVTEIPHFDAWVDDLWQAAAPHYAFIAERTLPALNRLYPPGHPRFLKLQVKRHQEIVGWTVALDTPMRDSRHFGNLRVGSVVDVLAASGAEYAVAAAATDFLLRRGVDLIVTNQAHQAWVKAFRRAGWLPGPSNFIFAAAPPLAARLQPWPHTCAQAHLTRGDGEGPTHL